MNIVLLADKKYRKPFESAIKKDPAIDLIGVEMLIRGNTMSRIAEHHNPHALVVYRNVPEKEGITVNDLIDFLRMKKPNMRIIYVYGSITDTQEYITLAESLLEKGITDIVTDFTADKVIENINTPMSEYDVREHILELTTPTEETNTESETVEFIPTEQEYIPLEVDFPSVTAIDNFDIDKVVYEVTGADDTEHLTIGVAQLQHHNGCTHTAFELATMLSKSYKVAVILADDDTFEALAVFHKLNPLAVKQGVTMHGIDVFPFELNKQIVKEYDVTIYDYSYLREERRKSFDECSIKLMLSSSAEWDISKITNFIRYNDDEYVRSITMLFPRVSQSKFLKYNKVFRKSGISAHRLSDSPDWTDPVADNISVYKHIIENYKLSKSKTPRRKLFKLK